MPQGKPAASESVGDTIKRRLKELGWQYPDVYRHSDLSAGTVRAFADGRRRPSLEMMGKIAELFDVDPEQWEEWRLAQARHLLDEREPPTGVGRQEALTNLSRFEAGLRAAPAQRSATRAAQPPNSPEPKR